MARVRTSRKRTPARADVLCTVCYSVPRQPCRAVLSKPGASKLKLGRVLEQMHEARLEAAGLPQRQRKAPAQRQPAPARRQPGPARQKVRNPPPPPKDAPTTRIIKAAAPGMCAVCGELYDVGTRIIPDGAADAAHATCRHLSPLPQVKPNKAAEQILRGGTFRGRKPSGWQLGKGPSSGGNRYY